MIKTYEVNNEMAGIVPMANTIEQEALNKDIAAAGELLLPIVLWKGQIIDGRCRQIACIAAGIEMKVRAIPDNTPREEVAGMVRSLNTRRNLTTTQKALSALRQQQNFGGTNAEIVRTCGVGVLTFKNVKYIADFSTRGANTRFFRTEVPIEDLFNGKNLNLVLRGEYIFSSKVNTIAGYIRENIQVVEKLDRSAWIDVSEGIASDAGKDWYHINLSLIGGEKVDINIRRTYAELANFKFPIVAERDPVSGEIIDA